MTRPVPLAPSLRGRPARRRRAWMTALVAAGLASLAPTVAQATTTSTTQQSRLGAVYNNVDQCTPNAQATWTQETGVKTALLTSYDPDAAGWLNGWTWIWPATDPAQAITDTYNSMLRVVPCYNSYYPGASVIWALPAPGPAQAVTSGELSTYGSMASYLASHGEANATIRLGWEMNGNWFYWSAEHNPAQWVANWQAVVTKMRQAAPSAHFVFDWNVNSSSSDGFNTFNAYPGDAYVDEVSDDIYDQNWNATSGYPIPAGDAAADIAKRQQYVSHYVIYGDASCQSQIANAPSQLSGECWRELAVQHGKKFAVSEWGVSCNTNAASPSCPVVNDGNGGGDDPYFIDAMTSWFEANNIDHAVYFDFTGSVDSRIDGALEPKSLSHLKADLAVN